MSDYLTVDEAAAAAGVTPAEMQELIRRGEVVGVRTSDGWFVKRENAEAYRAGADQVRLP